METFTSTQEPISSSVATSTPMATTESSTDSETVYITESKDSTTPPAIGTTPETLITPIVESTDNQAEATTNMHEGKETSTLSDSSTTVGIDTTTSTNNEAMNITKEMTTDHYSGTSISTHQTVTSSRVTLGSPVQNQTQDQPSSAAPSFIVTIATANNPTTPANGASTHSGTNNNTCTVEPFYINGSH